MKTETVKALLRLASAGCLDGDNGLIFGQKVGDVVRDLVNNRDELIRVVEAYEEAYTPDGHSAPNDCFATGPSTGNKIYDLVRCPGCNAKALADEALERD